MGTECADYPLKINMMGAEVCNNNNNNNNISRDEAKIIRTLQMMLVGATSLDLNLQEWAKIPIFLNIHSNAKNWIDRRWSVLLERIWIITLALFLMFDKWEEIGADVKTEGYQLSACQRLQSQEMNSARSKLSHKVRIIVIPTSWSEFSSSCPLSGKKKEGVRTCNL